MEKQKTNKREWVKTVLIVFLAVMLVLTFFSNTIMNRSLPEVATQSVVSGSIHAKIRGNGTVAANETYDVTLSQTRKIQSVLVRVGDSVQTGDVLLVLEPMESEELKQAQDTLADMELSYQKSLIEASNGTSTEDREVQKLREKYNESLRIYQLYSTSDPRDIELLLNNAKLKLKDFQNQLADAHDAVAAAQSELDDRKTTLAGLQAELSVVDSNIEEYESAINLINASMDTLDRDRYLHENNYNSLYNYAQNCGSGYAEGDEEVRMAAFAKDPMLLVNMSSDLNEETARQLANSYNVLYADVEAVQNVLDSRVAISYDKKFSEIYAAISKAAELQKDAFSILIEDALSVKYEVKRAEDDVTYCESVVADLQDAETECSHRVDDQQGVVDKYTAASSAADSLKVAEQALEDKLFEINLGDSGSLDIQHAKEAIEIQKKLIEALSSEADGQEIKANVSGVISAIHSTAGNTAGAQTPVVSITVADRGYTLQIPVTLEQARQVSIGDTAEISNYWNGNITATLENIINDPQNPTNGKVLMFRLSGDGVEPGANLTLAIGQRSANYDALVPNSAVRTDANGTFVLVVMAKSSPLGNRYIATRADVQVLASDDRTSAVSGLANGDFVITTSSVPIKAGDQVRLVDNG